MEFENHGEEYSNADSFTNNVIRSPMNDTESFDEFAPKPVTELDDNSEDDLCHKRKVPNRRIIDDNSDEDQPLQYQNSSLKVSPVAGSDNEESTSNANGFVPSSDTKIYKKSRVKAISSDSEEDSCKTSPEDTLVQDTKHSAPKDVKNGLRYMSMFQDSDLYDAEGSSDEDTSRLGTSCARINDVVKNEETPKTKTDKKKSFQKSHLYDAEGSSDDDAYRSETPHAEINYEKDDKKPKAKTEKKKSLPSRQSKQTALEEIHSETQRLVRQSRISLPYHQPKQRSLSEFLSRRKVPIIPLKTSTQQLSDIWQCIEEREKTVESFYKSESDNSEDENKNCDVESERDTNSSTVGTTCCNTGLIDSNFQPKINDDTYVEKKCSTILSDFVDSSLPIKNATGLSCGLKNDDLSTFVDKASVINEKTQDIENDSSAASKLEFTENSENDSLKLFLSEKTLFEISNVASSEQICNTDIEEDSLLQTSKNGMEKYGENKENISNNEINSTLISEESVTIERDNSERVENKNNKTKEKLNSLLNNSLIDIKLDSMPKISGSPDCFINLDEGSEKPEAFKLVARFMKHVKLKPRPRKQEEKVSVSIVEVNPKGEVNISEEVLSIKTTGNPKPGKTRIQLKEKLKAKIAQRREEEYVKRTEEYKLSEDILDVNSKDEFSETEEIEDFELSEEPTSESEPEENDVDLSDKVKKSSNPFLDEEAEESDDEGNEANAGDRDETSDFDYKDTNSDSLSLNIAPLLDQNNSIPDDIDQNTSIIGGLSALCSGVFPSQGLNLEDLEKDEKESNERQSEKFGLFSSEGAVIKTLDTDKKVVDDGDIESSDEEIFTKKRKKKAKITFSDDEDDGDVQPEFLPNSDKDDDSEINTDEDEDEGEGEDEIEDNKEVDEDEDEAFLNNPSAAAKRFFEDEAELSGSEYGSADEDEVDLDKYEEEQGDQDVFNQRKVQTELEKLHMKNILDDDKREIRILQELLLEDGELHSDGPKRQRQFKWYNQDENDVSLPSYLDDDDDKEDEIEEEDGTWRKTRLERESYLREVQGDLVEFDLLKVEKKIVRPSPKAPTPKVNPCNSTSPNPLKPFTLVSKRGSFLGRGDKVLSKLAEITNVNNDNALGSSKDRRNMVFAVVSPPKEEEPPEMASKRKNTEETPKTVKRLKYTTFNTNQNRASIFEKLKFGET